MFEAERPSLVPYAGRFDGFHAVTASVSKTCLMRFDNNRYSVSAHAVGRPVKVRELLTTSDPGGFGLRGVGLLQPTGGGPVPVPAPGSWSILPGFVLIG